MTNYIIRCALAKEKKNHVNNRKSHNASVSSLQVQKDNTVKCSDHIHCKIFGFTTIKVPQLDAYF